MIQTYLEIDKSVLRQNFLNVKSKLLPGTELIGVVKGNAYGLGLVEVARLLQVNGVDYLAVFNIEDAVTLKTEGIVTPVLILGPVAPSEYAIAVSNGFHLSVWDFDTALSLSKEAGKYGRDAYIHIKIDVGLHRLGVNYRDAADLIQRVAVLPDTRLQAIYSHFSMSSDPVFTKSQFTNFQQVLFELQQSNLAVKLHVANSNASINPDWQLDMVRVGAALYGISTSYVNNICPISWKAKIINIKSVEAGGFVGYEKAYQAKEKIKLAVIGCGYINGLPRSYSNKGEVIINGKRSKIIGNVCMDMVMADISNNPFAKVGEDAVLLGSSQKETITPFEMAENSQTSPYEVISRLSYNLERHYIE